MFKPTLVACKGPSTCHASSIIPARRAHTQTLVNDLKDAMSMGQLTEEEFKFIKKTVNAGAKKGLSDVDPKQLIKVKGEAGRPPP